MKDKNIKDKNIEIFFKKIHEVEKLIIEINEKLKIEENNTNIYAIVNSLYLQGLISKDLLDFFSKLKDIKQNFKNDRILIEELPILKNKINKVKLHLLTRFYHYI